jgi:hypothetical protein
MMFDYPLYLALPRLAVEHRGDVPRAPFEASYRL